MFTTQKERDREAYDLQHPWAGNSEEQFQPTTPVLAQLPANSSSTFSYDCKHILG